MSLAFENQANLNSSQVFSCETIGIEIITISIVGFSILFFVVSYLSTREAQRFLEKKEKNSERLMTDAHYRFLIFLGHPYASGAMLICALIYLCSVIIYLFNFIYIESFVILDLNFQLVAFNSLGLLIIFLLILFKAALLSTRETKKFMNEAKWVEGKTESISEKK